MAINKFKHLSSTPLDITGRVNSESSSSRPPSPVVFTESIQISANNTGGGGLILSDDGDFVDLNTGYGAFRFTSGIQVYSGNKSGSPIITLGSSGQIQTTGANNTADGGGQIFLNGATGNRIDFNTNGVAPPSFVFATARSSGTKIVLYPQAGASSVDYALGIDGNTLWYSVPTTSQQHRWYAATTQLADLKGSGELVIGSTSLTGTASQRLQVTGGAYFSQAVGIGYTAPGFTLAVNGSGYFNTNLIGTTVLAGTQTLTGTTNQNLQVTGGAYVSGSVGIGTTNPTDKLHVLGNGIRVDSATGALNFWNGAGFFGSIGIAAGFGPTNSDLVIRADAFRSLIFQTGGANDRGRINADGVFLVGTATSTGTASQALQVNSGAYVSGNLGVGVTNPLTKIDVWSTSQGSTAIRASSSPSFSTGIYPGVIAGLSTSAASANGSQFAAAGMGVTSGEIGVYSFYPTFANFPADRSPRRAVDLVGGFSTGTWGTEYFAINVGNNGSANDSQTITSEKVRVTASGNLGINSTSPTSRLDVVGDAKVSGITTSSRLTLNGLNNTADGGGQIFLNGATGNRIDFNTNGVAAPTFTTRSAGTKLVLYPLVSGSAVDYAFGIQSATLWHSVPEALSAYQFRWYGGTTQLADLKGSGEFLLGSTSIVSSAKLQVTGGGYFSSSVGIGTTNPQDTLDVGIGTIRLYNKSSPTRFSQIYQDGALTFKNANGGDDFNFYVGSGLLMRLYGGGQLVIGASTLTGTTNQKLQVDSGAYISGSVGIGTTNPQGLLNVNGGWSYLDSVWMSSASSLYLKNGSYSFGPAGEGLLLQVAGGDNITFAANDFAYKAYGGSELFRIKNSGNVGIGTTNPVSKMQVERFGVNTGFGTFSASVGISTDIDTFTISITNFKTIEYTLHIENSSGIQAQKVLVMQNGTTAYSQEYGIMYEPNQIVSIGATISSGVCKLQATPETGITGLTTYRFTRHTMI